MSRCLVGKEEGYFRWKGKLLRVLSNSETSDVIRVSCEEEMKLLGSQGPDGKGHWMPDKELLTIDNRIFKPGNGMIIQASVDGEPKGVR